MCPSPQESLGATEVSLKAMARLCVLVSPQSVLRSKSRCVCVLSPLLGLQLCLCYLGSAQTPLLVTASHSCDAPVCRCDAGMSVQGQGQVFTGWKMPLCPVLSHSTITRGPSGIICAQSFKATGEHGPSASSLDIPSPPLLKPIP